MRAVWLVALLALMPTAQAAPFLMHGVDAQGTGHLEDLGPGTTDVAYVLGVDEVDGVPHFAMPDSPVLILNGSAFFLTRPTAIGDASEAPGPMEPGPTALWRVRLYEADAAVVAAFSAVWDTPTLVSDGTRLVAVTGSELAAWHADGTDAWPSRIELAAAPEAYACRPGVYDPESDRFAFACEVRMAQTHYDRNGLLRIAQDLTAPSRVEVLSVRADGTGFWRAPVASVHPEAAASGTLFDSIARQPVVVDGRLVFAVEAEPPQEPCGAQATQRGTGGMVLSVQAWDVETGRPSFHTFRQTPWIDDVQAGSTRISERPGPVHLLATDSEVTIVSYWGLHRLDVATCRWTASVHIGEITDGSYFQPNLVVDNTTVYVHYANQLLAYERSALTPRWEQPDLPGIGPRTTDGILVGHDGIYLPTEGAIGSVYRLALDAGFPSLLVHANYHQQGRTAVGDGYLVHHNGLFNLTVFGPSAATIQIGASVVDPYVELGRPVQIDVSSTVAGRFHSDTTYDVDWGDGSTTARAVGPIIQHTYTSRDDYVVTVRAGNAAGQTATTTLVVHPGQDAPVPPSFLQTAFDAEHQELSFFILGLVATLLFAIVGLARHRRRHGILRREMQEIESVYNRNRDDPFRCEEKLDHERSRLRTLFLDRHLDDGQYALLKDRVDELGRLTRLGVVDHGFGFLPVSIANTLRGMLEDGRITEWERSMFVAAVEGDDQLLPSYKRRVVRLIDDWFRRDARAAQRPD